MENKEKSIEELFARIEKLTRQQKVFHDEIYRLHEDLHKLKASTKTEKSETEDAVMAEDTTSEVPDVQVPQVKTEVPPPLAPRGREPESVSYARSAWEDFIGTNLLNKVGIAVLVLGVGFGTKYSIDNRLLDPLTRIILGYLTGVVLTGIALRLRDSHKAFSAVLLSGGMAIFYFITYAAHSFYDLIPQAPAFALMVLFTVFTVFASLQYNLEVISIIALVGAYAVPLLLSDGSGRVVILFSYISVINTGVLALAFRKYWKRLYYLAFILTWLAFSSWFAFSFYRDHQITVSLVFASVFFITFFITFLAYKIARRESLAKGDVVCMLINSFLFYGFGYITLHSLEEGEQYLGLFTVLTALVHFVASAVIYKIQERRGDIFYFAAGMVLVFLTVAVPVQLEGNWVTLVWAGEAALMFWIGRSRALSGYERISYPLIVLASISLLHDWSEYYPASYFYSYSRKEDFQMFLNVQFLTSMLVASSLVLILWLNERHPAPAARPLSRLGGAIGPIVPVMALVVLYGGFYKEIEACWYNLYAASRMPVRDAEGVEYDQFNHYLLSFKNVWLCIFSALFATLLSWFAMKKWQKPAVLTGALILNSVVLFMFITMGLLELAELRTAYLDQEVARYYDIGWTYAGIRYVAIAAILPLLWCSVKIADRQHFAGEVGKGIHIYLHVIVLALLSSELIHWLDMARVENSFKLSLSILWGAYALLLVIYGLSRDLKHIRIAAMALFAVTLLKLFVYDMAGMSTILKTVVMIILGVLLLTASFVYNKFKRSAGNEAP